MEWGIETYKDLIQIITWGLGSLSIFGAVISYWYSRKHLNFNVIFNCNKRFQKIRTNLTKDGNKEAAKKYIDLCNEEIFYYENSFVPQSIMREWIDGMIFYIPHYTSENEYYHKAKLHDYVLKENEFEEYPRLEKVFKVSKTRDITDKDERDNLVNEIMNNID